MDDIYQNIAEFNPNQEHKILITFDKKLQEIATELFIKGKK